MIDVLKQVAEHYGYYPGDIVSVHFKSSGDIIFELIDRSENYIYSNKTKFVTHETADEGQRALINWFRGNK